MSHINAFHSIFIFAREIFPKYEKNTIKQLEYYDRKSNFRDARTLVTQNNAHSSDNDTMMNLRSSCC